MSKQKVTKYLTREELENVPTFWEPGKPVMLVLTFGWCIVGFYVRHETPLQIRVKHANHFRNAGVDYGVMSQKGPASTCEWRYEGDETINVNHIIRSIEYGGDIPTSRVR